MHGKNIIYNSFVLFSNTNIKTSLNQEDYYLKKKRTNIYHLGMKMFLQTYKYWQIYSCFNHFLIKQDFLSYFASQGNVQTEFQKCWDVF